MFIPFIFFIEKEIFNDESFWIQVYTKNRSFCKMLMEKINGISDGEGFRRQVRWLFSSARHFMLEIVRSSFNEKI